jgi:hypothetical protein
MFLGEYCSRLADYMATLVNLRESSVLLKRGKGKLTLHLCRWDPFLFMSYHLYSEVLQRLPEGNSEEGVRTPCSTTLSKDTAYCMAFTVATRYTGFFLPRYASCFTDTLKFSVPDGSP